MTMAEGSFTASSVLSHSSSPSFAYSSARVDSPSPVVSTSYLDAVQGRSHGSNKEHDNELMENDQGADGSWEDANDADDSLAKSASTNGQPQRACTQCQKHKIKCVNNADTGPCVRCQKKGLLCTIAPRKKRVSKKKPQARQGETVDSYLKIPYPSGSNGPASSSNAISTNGVASNDPYSMIVSEHLSQSTISSSEFVTVYLSSSFLCPGILQRISNAGVRDVYSSKLPNKVPCKSLCDSPTDPIFVFSFPNDICATRPMSTYDLAAVNKAMEWKMQYGDMLVDM